MARGGTRPGAGRKVKAILYQSPIREAEGKIRDRLPWLVDRLMVLAEGVTVEEPTRDGAIVYQRPPDRQACEYLIDRIMGKPTQPVNLVDEARRLAEAHGLDAAELVRTAELIAAGKG